MKSKAARLVRRNHARYHQGRDDLNIVPMIDMMVILVFFLIFTAVFSKTNILQLNLPASNTAPVELPKGLKLEVIIRANDLVVNDRNSGPLKVIDNIATGPDLDHLSEFMRQVGGKLRKTLKRILDPVQHLIERHRQRLKFRWPLHRFHTLT